MTATATIDGKVCEVLEGESILTALHRLQIDLPTLCTADGLEPEGGCRMCLVRMEGVKRPVAACHTRLEPGARICSVDPELESVRRTIMKLYLDTAGQTGLEVRRTQPGKFRDLLAKYGLDGHGETEHGHPDASHPFLRFDAPACITCRLCLHACNEIQGQFVYGVAHRGYRSKIIYGPGDTFHESACVACGACVDVCPTGAIQDRDSERLPPPAATLTQSVCGYCGVGCRIEIEADEKIVRRITGIREAKVNHGHLCVKGRFAHTWHHSPERLSKPLIREGGALRKASWDEAIAFIVRRLTEIKDESGPDALGAFASSRSTNEACYLLQKLFRAVVGTNNVDCCARVCHSSTALALQLVTGTGAATASFADIENARCIVVAGANPTEAHPVIGARIKQAALRGVPLIVVDPRRIELADYATCHLQLVPGTNVSLFNAIAKILIEEELIDLQFLSGRTEGFSELKAHLDSIEFEDAAAPTGVSSASIWTAARLIGTHSPVLFVHGLGLSELVQGTASVMCLCNLAMLTGNIGKAGAGMLPLRGQNNVQGSADMGSSPTHFPGYQPVGDPAARSRIQRIWGQLPPALPGLTSPLMLRAAAEGRIRGLWLMGEDVAQSDPNETEVLKALENLDLVIVQDPFPCESASYAHVVLPAAGYLEQEGTFTNGERRIQLVRPAVPPPGDARPDWLTVLEVARRFGADWSYDSPAAVMDEIAKVAPLLFGGVSYSRLEPDGLQWPCPHPGHSGTPTVHKDGFIRGKGLLTAVDYQPSPEHGVAGYPYLLVTGRLLEHYNVGTMTRRSGLDQLVSGDLLEIHPEDASRQGIPDGSSVQAESRWGSIPTTIRYSNRVAPGTLFLTFHFPGTHTNRLTGPALDPESNCPHYKATAVRLIRLEEHHGRTLRI